MKPNRRLALRRETLTELRPDELARTAGGQQPPTWRPTECSVADDCLRDLLLKLTLHQHCSWSCID